MNPDRRRTLAHGLVAGAIGYAVVVVFFAVANVLQGHSPLFTAALLGHALLGERSGAVAAQPVLVYNGLHLLVFLAIGLVASWLVAASERRPQLWYLLLFLGLFVFFHLFGAVAALAARPGPVISLSLVLAASLAAVAGMAAYLWAVHPELRDALGEDLEDPLPRPAGR